MYQRFGKSNANLYWVIDSLFDFTLNLSEAIYSIYMADITHCYESILLTRADNLHKALNFIINLTYRQHHTRHRKEQVIWVHIKEATGKADSAKWSTNFLGTSCWIPLSQERLITLQQWLITSYYVRLGDAF